MPEPADIIERVQSAIRDELMFAPSSLTDEDRAAIEDQLLSHTRLIVDALSTEEMNSEGALLSHIANARWDATRLIRERHPSN